MLEHAATQALDRPFSEAYSRDAADLREAAEDYEQSEGAAAPSCRNRRPWTKARSSPIA